MPNFATERTTIVDEFEIIKILKAVKDDWKLLWAVAIAWETGARISELIQLKPKDFSEEGHMWVISIPTLKQRYKIHGEAPRRLLKIKKDNIYEKIIKPLNDKQPDFDKRVINVSDGYLRKKIRLRYPDVYFHWFRHSRATLWSKKFDIFALKYAMGWKDITMANRYVHQEDMANKMAELQDD